MKYLNGRLALLISPMMTVTVLGTYTVWWTDLTPQLRRYLTSMLQWLRLLFVNAHISHGSMMILGQPDGMYGDWRGGSRQQGNAVWVQFKHCPINGERPFALLERSLMQRLRLNGGLELHHLAAILVICGNQWTLYWVKSGRRAYLHLRPLIFIIAWIRRLMTSEQQRRQLLLRCLRIIRRHFLYHFESVVVGLVTSILMTSPTKQCSLDPLPMWLMNDCVSVLAPCVTSIINASLRTGYFPLAWRKAIVSPLLKKSGLDESTPGNYRTVSNVTFLSKVLERVVN